MCYLSRAGQDKILAVTKMLPAELARRRPFDVATVAAHLKRRAEVVGADDQGDLDAQIVGLPRRFTEVEYVLFVTPGSGAPLNLEGLKPLFARAVEGHLLAGEHG